ncbi:hypothetical protein EV284_3491 [Streptomyces sp. BK022]|uniref:hypothetical protein n=1 Tax=Streptomyces sp. BK022 TaxID=2512123 RepID=UPI00102A785C|nr:hypothetical protein [Streptomyces sp. BK022]RZU36008.1 hypothetical protein EV284_3491 [Streptomyces sp. BK022]
MENFKVLYTADGERRVTGVSYSRSAAETAAKQMGGTVVGPFKPGQVVEPEDVEQPRAGRVVQRKHTTRSHA